MPKTKIANRSFYLYFHCMHTDTRDIVIIGGGLAGLVNSILLARHGFDVLLIERKSYPFHRVCGEYISNEVVPFLKRHGLFPEEFQPSCITRLSISAISGKAASADLDLGGFGISRYVFDQFLYQKAVQSGVTFALQQSVEGVSETGIGFATSYGNGKTVLSKLVIGAFGKRSKLDKQLDRSFIHQRSPFIGVKYHIKTDLPPDLIALHNFPGGYCGVVRVEGDKYNLCYLSNRYNLKKHGDVATMEKEVLCENPKLKTIFENSDFLNGTPEVINEISFEKKETVKDGILMSGDAAGLITPLCGNGMAMAIHSAKILSDAIILHSKRNTFNLAAIEKQYQDTWKKHFSARLWAGRKTQHLFGNRLTSQLAVGLLNWLPPIARGIVASTHGKPF